MRRNKKLTELACANCGKIFTLYNSQALYRRITSNQGVCCSRSCRSIMRGRVAQLSFVEKQKKKFNKVVEEDLLTFMSNLTYKL